MKVDKDVLLHKILEAGADWWCPTGVCSDTTKILEYHPLQPTKLFDPRRVFGETHIKAECSDGRAYCSIVVRGYLDSEDNLCFERDVQVSVEMFRYASFIKGRSAGRLDCTYAGPIAGLTLDGALSLEDGIATYIKPLLRSVFGLSELVETESC